MYLVWGYTALGLVVSGIALGVFTLARNPPVDTPRLGMRGLKRQQALAEGGSFGSIEPLMRMVAGWVAHLPLGDKRRDIDQMLKHSGDWLGLTANEFVALSLMGGVGFTAFGLAAVTLAELPSILVFFFAGLGLILPYVRASGEQQKRFKEVNRSLPGAIDLASLCMGAGLDFPGSIRQIVDKAGRRDALVDELQVILQELDLGRTRRQALENFADRCPTEAVRDFVGTVIQSEEKGNPLAEVLRIQANMLRMRRSVMAEESAARAAVLMMGPLMLIFGAIILVLLGPFIVNSMNSGF
ncbi:MAG TPA: type II secretion system F family protein [Sandaracinaceae bacterium LLY-WYZ-13_1]|nr:type II secretion system F family protein [Sandaracinaceae bacterium LLY-WYZ-13_1]